MRIAETGARSFWGETGADALRSALVDQLVAEPANALLLAHRQLFHLRALMGWPPHARRRLWGKGNQVEQAAAFPIGEHSFSGII